MKLPQLMQQAQMNLTSNLNSKDLTLLLVTKSLSEPYKAHRKRNWFKNIYKTLATIF